VRAGRPGRRRPCRPGPPPPPLVAPAPPDGPRGRGRRSRAARTTGSSTAAAVGNAATLTRPDSRPASAARSCSAASSRSAIASACISTRRPASVSVTPRPARTTSGVPAEDSSSRTCELTAGCVQPRARAAPASEPARATSRKTSNRRGSPTGLIPTPKQRLGSTVGLWVWCSGSGSPGSPHEDDRDARRDELGSRRRCTTGWPTSWCATGWAGWPAPTCSSAASTSRRCASCSCRTAGTRPATCCCARAQVLEAAGAELVVLCTNYMHKTAPRLEARAQRAVPAHRRRGGPGADRLGVRRLGLTGAGATMAEPFYADRLRSHGMDVRVPEHDDRQLLDRAIFDELCQGVLSDSTRTALRGVLARLDRAGSRGGGARLHRARAAPDPGGLRGAAAADRTPARRGRCPRPPLRRWRSPADTRLSRRGL
jgi:hypothetical protein